MRRIRVLLTVVSFAAVACSVSRVPDTLERPVALPESAYGRAVSTEGWLTIHLTRDGEVLCEGCPRTLDELEDLVARVARESAPEPDPTWFPGSRRALPILVCADREAPYLHMAWLRTIAPGAAFAVVTEGRRAVLRTPDTAEFWEHWSGLLGASMSEDTMPVIHRPFDVTIKEIRAARAKLAGTYSAPLLGALDVPTTAPFREVVAAMDRFRAVGVDFVELPEEFPHTWVRRQRRLPRPRVSRLLDWSDSARCVSELVLPLAATATPRGDQFGVVVDLTANGEIVYRGKRMNLEGLAASFHREAENHEFLLRQRGGSGFDDEGFSTLPVLLRAEGAARWKHVRWVLAIMEEQRVRHVRFGAMAEADLSYPVAEAERHGVARNRIPGLDEDELYVPTPSEPVEGIDMAVDGRRYTLDGKTTTDLGELTAWLRTAAPRAARVRATPSTPWQEVVAAVSRLKEAGCDTIGFVIGPPPDAEVRKRKRLP